jgi:hypothetical protein
MTLCDQLIDNTHALLGRRVVPNQVPHALKSLFMRLKDDDPILDTSEKIATIRQAHFRAKCGRHHEPTILCHLYMGLHKNHLSKLCHSLQ